MIERGLVREYGRFLQGSCIVHLMGPNGVPARVEAVVDTGFSGSVSLPRGVIDQLELPNVGFRDCIMADGSEIRCEFYDAEIDWQGEFQIVEVADLGGLPLIGMELMRGSEIRVMVEDGGVIEVTPFHQL